MGKIIVMKFGGTSVEDAQSIRNLVKIVRNRVELTKDCKVVVVVSAMAKVTDSLYNMAAYAAALDDISMERELEAIKTRHYEAANSVLEPQWFANVDKRLGATLNNIEGILRWLRQSGELSKRELAQVVSHGEILSSVVVSAAFLSAGVNAMWADAREFMITDSNYMSATPLSDKICEKSKTLIKNNLRMVDVIVTQGFIASNTKGDTTLLGRGGSDYSASLIGMAIDADEIDIWTDVDGVRTADPRRVPTSKRIDCMSFEMAARFAHYGAKILHPSTMSPAIEKNIPIRVLCSKTPQESGTLIVANPKRDERIGSIVCKDNISVFKLHKSDFGNSNIRNTASFVSNVIDVFAKCGFKTLLVKDMDNDVSVTIEHIQQDMSQALGVLVTNLLDIGTVAIDNNCAQISIVGFRPANVDDFCKKCFGKDGQYDIYQFYDGAALNDLSFVVGKENVNATLNKIHRELFE